jgi:subtilisin family serine protease
MKSHKQRSDMQRQRSDGQQRPDAQRRSDMQQQRSDGQQRPDAQRRSDMQRQHSDGQHCSDVRSGRAGVPSRRSVPRLPRWAWPLLALPFLGALPSQAAWIDPQLQHLLAFRDGRLPIDAPFAPASVRQDHVRLYVTFKRTPSAADLRGLERQGVGFTRLEGSAGPAHVGLIYGVKVPWSLLPALERDPRIDRLEAVERRGRVPTMDLSMPEIQADTQRVIPQAGADGLTGRGQVIADFDTSVDLYHPALFKPDGGLYSWIDADEDGKFTPGIDAVDLNGDGKVNQGETLRLQENALFDVQYGPLIDGFLDADQDWLYADTDNDGKRDYGTTEKFGEKDLAYGEPLFIVDDEDGDNDLSPGEPLIRLGTSKVVAAMDGTGSGTVHTRGTNLLTLTPDPYPHGTSVADILLGDLSGRRFVGVAPEAELLAIDYEGKSFDIVSAMSWAKGQSADVMMYEFGNWTSEFLDGSSALEQAITNMASSGIPQVCPAGNIGQNNKHGKVLVPAGGNAIAVFFVDGTFAPTVTYLTGLWRQSLPKLRFDLVFISSDGVSSDPSITAIAGSTKSNTAGDYVSAVSSTSSRGTNMFDMTLYRQVQGKTVELNQGLYTLTVTNTGTSTATLHLWLADDKTAWSGGVTWITDPTGQSVGVIADPNYSVSSPATADGCIAVASYATRQREILGDLSRFSSRGPRIDETSLLDVAAPGNYDVYSAAASSATYYDASINQSPNYPHGTSWLFSGTSASAPHVAGTAALLKQLDSSLTHAQVEKAIRDGAVADTLTGTVPNERWGYGKLRVGNTVLKGDKAAPTFSVLVDRHPVFPNYLVVTVVPSERLSGPPSLSSSTTTVGAVVEVGPDLYTSTFLAPKSGTSITLSVSGKDLSGNTGISSTSYTY